MSPVRRSGPSPAERGGAVPRAAGRRGHPRASGLARLLLGRASSRLDALLGAVVAGMVALAVVLAWLQPGTGGAAGEPPPTAAAAVIVSR